MNAVRAFAECSRNAFRTSSPTSKAFGPIAGPSHTSTSSGEQPMAFNVFSMTPLSKPRQPAWAAATTPPARSQNNSGRQSAVITAQTTSVSDVHEASASGFFCPVAASTVNVPCTCCSQQGSAGRSAARAARLAVTLSGSSPTCSPRLSVFQGGGLQPPVRRVCKARTFAGAGQSGSSIPGRVEKPDRCALSVFKIFQEFAHIGWWRCLPLHLPATKWVQQTQAGGVQGLTVKFR